MPAILRWSSLAFIIVGILLLSSLIYAQDDETSASEQYMGVNECTVCHGRGFGRTHFETGHARTLQDVTDDKEAILAQFDDDIPSLTFPGESDPRSVSAEDISYTIGSGRYVQRYVYTTEDNTHLVLPIEWNTTTQQWQPFADSDGEWLDFVQSCAGCHTVGLNIETGEWVDDGVQCEACHGPGGAHVEVANDVPRRPSDEDYIALRANIVLSPDPQICGQCHNRGVSEVHDLPYPVEYRPGSALLDTYTLHPPDDTTHWWNDQHARQPNMQYNEWYHSAHASAVDTMRSSSIAEDSCLQCHSGDYRWTAARIALFDDYLEGPPPDPVTVETAQYGVTCANCHNHHSEEELPAYLVAEPYTLCVTCHANTPQGEAQIHHPVQEMYEGQPLVEGIEGVPSVHYDAEDGPDCLTCHMIDLPVESGTRSSHALRPVLPAEAEPEQPDACSSCHVDLTTTDLQYLIDDTQAAVRSRLTTGWARLASVDADQSPEQYNQVVRALTFVQNDGSLGVHNYRYANALLDEAERTLAGLSVPGAQLSPTEAPAPTAISDVPWWTFTAPEPAEEQGVRRITIFVLGFTGLILFGAAIVVFRKPKQKQGDEKDESDDEDE